MLSTIATQHQQGDFAPAQTGCRSGPVAPFTTT
jgi:hypothetical protein